MPGEGDYVLNSRNASEETSQRDPGVRTFTWQELSRLNQRHNAHVAVRGKVYDVSSFIARHPGGADQLLLGAGRDITTLFESYHHFSNYKVLEKYYVGELISNELPVFPEPSEFHKTVKERVNTFFKDNHIDPKICHWMFLRYAVFLLLTSVCWTATVYFHNFLVLSLFLAIAWGLSQVMLGVSIFHDASHFAVTHRPWVWKAMGAICDCFIGVSFHVWMHEHVLGHHCYTNIEQGDPEVFIGPDTLDIRRFHTSQKWFPRYFYQHIYLPFLYCFVGIKKRIQDFSILYKHKYATGRINPLTNSQLALSIIGKCVFIVFYLILPSLYMHWAKVLLFVLVGDFIGWYYLVIITQVTHLSTDVVWPIPDEKNCIDSDWAELQVASCVDYATDSWFWNIATGALNNQIAHHLFPGVIQSHYPKITPIVRKTCKEFGIKFRHVSTAREALHLHLEFLRQRGQREGEDE